MTSESNPGFETIAVGDVFVARDYPGEYVVVAVDPSFCASALQKATAERPERVTLGGTIEGPVKKTGDRRSIDEIIEGTNALFNGAAPESYLAEVRAALEGQVEAGEISVPAFNPES